MASLLESSRLVKERVRTYNADAIAELVAERGDGSEPSTSYAQESRKSRNSPLKLPSIDNNLAERKAAQRAVKAAELAAKAEEFMKRTERQAQEKAQREEMQFQSMYNDVLGGLSNENGIMGDTKFTLEHSSKVKGKKKEALYEEWNKEVFEKIQDRLQPQVDTLTTRQIESKLKTNMDAYLHTTNTKLGVFRDVIIEEDYNPLATRDTFIKVPTGDIRDPLKRDVLKPFYERRLMGGSVDSLLGLGRSGGKFTLEPTQWGDLAIHSTPYGHCVDSTGGYVVRPQSVATQETRKSRIPMDHYDYPRTNEAAAVEMGKPGKALGEYGMCTAKGVEGARQFFDVVQHTVHMRPDVTGGDVWLEAKGKNKPPGPDERRGNLGMQAVIQQTSNPYVTGQMGGDLWMEHKGKANVPGPEQRRGRADLREIVQQSSNPYKDGRSLGDTWLEAKGKRPIPGAPCEAQEVVGRTDGQPQPVTKGKLINPPQPTSHITVAHLSLTTTV